MGATRFGALQHKKWGGATGNAGFGQRYKTAEVQRGIGNPWNDIVRGWRRREIR
jgi:hypothetical protein